MNLNRIIFVVTLTALSSGCREKPPATNTIDKPAEKPAEKPPEKPPEKPVETGKVYDVVLVAANDTLNMRATPDHQAAVVDQLPFDRDLVESTGQSKTVGTQQWLEARGAKATGWVNATYLTEHVEVATFL